jgi:hydroxyacylglutathione hydrolase
LSLDELSAATEKRTMIVDARSKVSFAGGHLPGSINIQNNKSFSTWAGWMVPYDAPFIIIAHGEQLDEITRKLMRIGLDTIAGSYPNVTDWQEAGHDLAELRQMHLDELQNAYTDPSVTVIDVRSESEHIAGHIPGARNIHGGYLRDHLDDVPRDTPVVIACQGGDRSSIASSYLMREGFTNIHNFPQGFGGWKSSGAPVEQGESA